MGIVRKYWLKAVEGTRRQVPIAAGKVADGAKAGKDSVVTLAKDTKGAWNKGKGSK